MKIIKTNWINIIGVFIAVFLYAIALNLIDTNVSRNLFQSVLPALILVCLYGLVFWVLLILLLVILDLLLDLLLIVKKTSNPRVKLLIEWLIIGSPFTYWAVRYGQGIFIAGVISLLITQFIRWKHIKAVLKAN
ncbi:hypothetical protein [Chitinophaga sp. LS1]|uniref:hypothetical protein n=1 Tax=Chitinophaga sp. LS1 TaxID=3051176 RepID=UPI002AABAAB0|nr:hypothetical protein [Chitinophaga sp. LS1]WPV69691.1 hypothetical protein QQL36_13385 [Chitinophaga sp. LS1]